MFFDIYQCRKYLSKYSIICTFYFIDCVLCVHMADYLVLQLTLGKQKKKFATHIFFIAYTCYYSKSKYCIVQSDVMRSAVSGVDERTPPACTALQLQYGGRDLRRRTTSSRFLPENCCKATVITSHHATVQHNQPVGD